MFPKALTRRRHWDWDLSTDIPEIINKTVFSTVQSLGHAWELPPLDGVGCLF